MGMGVTLRWAQQPNHHFFNSKTDYAERRTHHENGSVHSLWAPYSTEHISHDILKAKSTEVMQPLINLSDKMDYSSTPRTIIRYYFFLLRSFS